MSWRNLKLLDSSTQALDLKLPSRSRTIRHLEHNSLGFAWTDVLSSDVELICPQTHNALMDLIDRKPFANPSERGRRPRMRFEALELGGCCKSLHPAERSLPQRAPEHVQVCARASCHTALSRQRHWRFRVCRRRWRKADGAPAWAHSAWLQPQESQRMRLWPDVSIDLATDDTLPSGEVSLATIDRAGGRGGFTGFTFCAQY